MRTISARRLWLSASLLGALACERRAPPPAAEQPAPPTTSQLAAPPTNPAPIASPPPSPPPVASACVPAPLVDPAALVTTWPQRLGERVRFTGRVERAVDLLTATRYIRQANSPGNPTAAPV